MNDFFEALIVTIASILFFCALDYLNYFNFFINIFLSLLLAYVLLFLMIFALERKVGNQNE